MPVGNSSNWTEKTAETESELFTAAKNYISKKVEAKVETKPEEKKEEVKTAAIEEKKEEKKMCETCKCDPCTCKAAAPCATPAVDASVAPVAEKADTAVEEVKEAVDEAKVALEKVETKVEEATGVAPTGKEDVAKEVDEVTIEIEDDKPEDIIVESTPSITPVAKSDVKTEKTAAVEEEFLKFSAISPKNRAKLKSYWGKDLGFPADYVALLVKDYEK